MAIGQLSISPLASLPKDGKVDAQQYILDLLNLANQVNTLVAAIFPGGILPVANGGTNNGTAYTAGSVIFSDGTKLTQDNTNLFWDSTAKRLGIGTNTLLRLLSIGPLAAGLDTYTSGNPGDAMKAVGSSPGSGFGVQNTNAAGFSGVEYLDNTGALAVFSGYKNGGTGEFRVNNVAVGGFVVFKIGGTTYLTISNTGDIKAEKSVIANGPTSTIRLKGYTVATLPAGVQGDMAFVTDALAPTFLTVIAGGGTVVAPVFFNGTNWVGV